LAPGSSECVKMDCDRDPIALPGHPQAKGASTAFLFYARQISKSRAKGDRLELCHVTSYLLVTYLMRSRLESKPEGPMFWILAREYRILDAAIDDPMCQGRSVHTSTRDGSRSTTTVVPSDRSLAPTHGVSGARKRGCAVRG